jgi:hypothetical protein
MHLQRARYPDGWWIHTVDMFGSLLLVLIAVSLISISFVQFVFCFQQFLYSCPKSWNCPVAFPMPRKIGSIVVSVGTKGRA